MSPVPPENPESDLGRVWRVLTKNLLLVGLCACGGLAGAVAYLKVTPPIFEAACMVKVADQGQDSESIHKQDATAAPGSPNFMETYMELARSTNVAARAAAGLKLGLSPEYRAAGPAGLVGAVQANLSVKNAKNSNVMVFLARSNDPAAAAALANTYAQSFIDANLDFKHEGAVQQRDFVEKQLAEVKARLSRGEEALKRFSIDEKDLTGSNGEEDRNPVEALKAQVLNLEIERATLAARYHATHPRLQEVEAELKAAQEALDKELSRIPENDQAVSRLSRQVKMDESTYNLLLEKLEEARIAENVDDSGIVVVDKAGPPRAPVKPKHASTLGLGGFLGLCLGLAGAFALESFRDRIDSESEVKLLTGLPCLGVIPNFRAEGGKELTKPSVRFSPDYLITHKAFEGSYYRESFHILRTNLLHSSAKGDSRALAVLSANVEEGKTLLNANLAISLAQAGKKVLLVDADLRKPSLHRAFAIQARNQRGLPGLIQGDCDMAEAVVATKVKDLWLVPNAFPQPNAAQLLQNEALARVVAHFKQAYDMVVFDGAPLLQVTDSVLLSTLLDGVLLAARSGVTRRTEFLRASAQLHSVGVRVLGSVLNGVSMNNLGYQYRPYPAVKPNHPFQAGRHASA